ncbi:MAG: polyphosphate kinase 1 [Bacteroidales bacterium]|nr:polyphosphate kinase 1 [Bacteroidales bacterium]
MSKKKFINREISWLHFNARVLQEATDPLNPLFERLRFVGIYSNNRDEFFRVRVATLRRLNDLQKEKQEMLDFNPAKILKQIRTIINHQEQTYGEAYRMVRNELRDAGFNISTFGKLNISQLREVKRYFLQSVRPFLFPIMLGGIKDTQGLQDNSIYLLVRLRSTQTDIKEDYALVEVPTSRVSRFFLLPDDGVESVVVLLDDVIRYNLEEIFLPFGYDIFDAYSIKFTRDAELDFENDLSKSFLEILAESVKQRKRGVPVRFIYDKELPTEMLDILLKKFKINKKDILIPGSKYHNFRDFMNFPRIGPASLWAKPLPPMRHPDLPPYQSIFAIIKNKDVMLHFPYHTFNHIIDLLREASIDPKVKSIKITLYRTATDSNVVNALVNAARNGKSVTVFLELQARFDENTNIRWSEKLHEEGVKIIKTIPGLKVHAKLLLIRRKEGKENIYYTNISTGNFNEVTAQIYADDSLLTSNEQIGLEVSQMFKLFEAPYSPPKFKKLIISPYHTRKHFLSLLNTEIRNVKKGKEAWCTLKMNSLVDETLIRKLYAASQSGVKIRIICRGICMLIPGQEGLSENIEVISIIDRFLEHSRIYVFANGGNPLYYIASADWMVRNLDHRFEIVCPIEDQALQKEIADMLQIQWADNCKARWVNKTGSGKINTYRNNTINSGEIRSQPLIYNYFKEKAGNIKEN